MSNFNFFKLKKIFNIEREQGLKEKSNIHVENNYNNHPKCK